MGSYRVTHVDAQGVKRRMRVHAFGRAAALAEVQLRFGPANYLSAIFEGRRV